jgi:hypothetical protein
MVDHRHVSSVSLREQELRRARNEHIRIEVSGISSRNGVRAFERLDPKLKEVLYLIRLYPKLSRGGNSRSPRGSFPLVHVGLK